MNKVHTVVNKLKTYQLHLFETMLITKKSKLFIFVIIIIISFNTIRSSIWFSRKTKRMKQSRKLPQCNLSVMILRSVLIEGNE